MSMGEVDLEVHQDPVSYRSFDLSAAGLRVTGWSAAVYGWTLYNPSGSVVAEMDIYDSDSATGTVVMPVSFAASESVGDWFGPQGILFKNGVFVNVTAGEVKGSIFYRHIRL